MGKKAQKRKRIREQEQQVEEGAGPTAECAGPEAAGGMERNAYRKKMAALGPDMARFGEWIASSGLHGIVLLEGLGPAGKRRTAEWFADGLGARVANTLTLGPPDKKERDQWPFGRFVERFPAAGNLVIFDGGWYHAAAVERALGLRSEEDFARFLRACVAFEQALAESGVVLFKYWFTADDDEQERRFRDRIKKLARRKELKLPDELPAAQASVAAVQQAVLACTDHEACHWHVIPANDKRRARLCCIEHLVTDAPQQETGENAAEPASKTPG